MTDPLGIAVGGVGFGSRPLAVGGLNADPPQQPYRNTRAIAVQGLGFGRVLTALQGFFASDESDTQMHFQRRRKKEKRRDTDEDVLLFLLK